MINSSKMDQYWSIWCQGSSNHQTQEILRWNMSVEVNEFNEAAEVLRPEKSLLRTKALSRFLNPALFWCFERKFILVESWNIMLNFSTFPVGGCWGQLMLLVWKLAHETQISKPPEATRHHSVTLLVELKDQGFTSLLHDRTFTDFHIKKIKNPIFPTFWTDFILIFWEVFYSLISTNFNAAENHMDSKSCQFQG